MTSVSHLIHGYDYNIVDDRTVEITMLNKVFARIKGDKAGYLITRLNREFDEFISGGGDRDEWPAFSINVGHLLANAWDMDERVNPETGEYVNA